MRHRTRTTILATSLVALLALLLSACGGGGGSTPGAGGSSGDPVLRVGVQKDGIRSVLTASGLLDDFPYEIEWSEFTSGPPLVEAAAADKIDVAWVGSAPPIFGAAAGAEFKIVAAVVEEDQHSDSILVPADSDITSIEDLVGRKVAVGRGTSAHGLLLNTLTNAGLSIDDVDVQFLAPPDGQAAFQSGSVDAWSTWDPYTTATVDATGAVDLTRATDTVGDDPHLSFEIASQGALDDPARREAVSAYVDLLARAFAWANEHQELWAEGWAEESGLPLETTQAVVQQKVPTVLPVDADHIASQQQLADAFAEAGEIPRTIDFASVVEEGVFSGVGSRR